MNTRLASRSLSISSCRINGFFLACFWYAGIILGCFLSYACRFTFVSLMRSSVCARLTIYGLLACNYLPLLISVFAVIYSFHCVSYAVLAIRGFSLGFLITALIYTFSAGAWLICILFLGPCCLVNGCVTLFLLKGSSADTKETVSSFLFYAAAVSTISMIEYLYICPFLYGLFNILER